MECVTSVSYSVLINGEKTVEFKPSRGLKQRGDPLSPYLFLLCTEGLSALIHNAMEKGKMEGVKVSRRSPCICHLLFADDCLIFCKATVGNALAMMKILRYYEEASGQLINIEKLAASFSSNTPTTIRETVMYVLGISSLLGNDKYLGLPMFFGKSKASSFGGLIERLEKKLVGWKQKCLPKAGREVLIKSATQVIPTYSMSCFKLLALLLKEIHIMIARFWWGADKNERKIHWVSWKKLCIGKTEGGMGFKHLGCFNDAMLAKQGWRLLQNPDFLAARILKSKYFPGCSFLES